MSVIKILTYGLLHLMAGALSYDENLARTVYSFSRPAYCNQTFLRTWTCDPCKQHPRFQELQVFYNDSHAAQGYCGYDPDQNYVVLAIRGTEDDKNWLADTDYTQINYGCTGCKVHRGFNRVYEDLANNLLACAYTLHSNHPKAQVLVTGHSLGAAVATFAALEIHQKITTVNVFYNFGQPRVGNAQFKTYMESQFSHLFLARVTHWKDTFVHLPTQTQGFTHYGNEIFYDEPFDTYKTCGSEDKSCADQFPLPSQWNTDQHLFYYKSCAGCQNYSCDKK